MKRLNRKGAMLGAFMLIPAVIIFGVTMLAGVMLSLFGFILSGRRKMLREGFQIWAVVLFAAALAIFPVFCAIDDPPDGRGNPTQEDYAAMVRTFALWSLLPGISLTAAGSAQMILVFRRGKRTSDSDCGGPQV